MVFLVGLVLVVGQRRFRGDIDEQMISQVAAIDILQNNQKGSCNYNAKAHSMDSWHYHSHNSLRSR